MKGLFSYRYTLYPFSALLIYFVLTGCLSAETGLKSWEKAGQILDSIHAPEFKEIRYSVLDFGAVADKRTNCTAAINEAIKTCSENGGGTVLIPSGEYFTGPIRLLSHVNLHIEENATLYFSTDPVDYLPLVLTRWEGMDCYNYSPLIFAYKAENIAITGSGKLDGQASDENWWTWKDETRKSRMEGTGEDSISGRRLLMYYEQNEIAVEERKMGEGHFLRPPFIQFFQCKTVLIEDITIENSPFWLVHPLLSENVIVRGIKANSLGPNSDGCDPESCNKVLIEDCHFNTGDDCIAIKSGRNFDGRRWNIPSQNIVIRNCEMKEGHGGVVIGSEISGGCKDVFVENCQMNSPNLDRAIRIKTNGLRGGVVENIFVRNITVGEVKEAVLKINCLYETKSEEGDFPPLVQNVYLENVTSEKSKYPVHLTGFTRKECIRNIYIFDSRFDGVEKKSIVSGVSHFVTKGLYINGELVTTKE